MNLSLATKTTFCLPSSFKGNFTVFIYFQSATSIKVFLDNWNKQTALWLRLICYDRIPVQKRLATFLLSAMWHGCYAGYYFTFVTGVPFSDFARKVG